MPNEEKKDCLVCGYNKKYLYATVILLAIAGGFFFLGAKYEKNKLIRFGVLKNSDEVCFVPVNRENKSASGEILSIGHDEIMIKSVEGKNLQIIVSPETNIGRKNETLADFSVGSKVIVRGFEDADGKILAHSIKWADATEQVK